jgi:hypothetical protein
MPSVDVRVSTFAFGEGGLSVSVGSDPPDSLAGVRPSLSAVFSACEAVMARTEAGRAFRMGRRGLIDEWPGAGAEANRLVEEILTEQQSHYCCADSSTLVAQWPGPDAPALADVPALVVQRQVEERERQDRERAADAEARPRSPVEEGMGRLLVGLTTLFGAGSVAQEEVGPPTLQDIDPATGGLAEALHAVGGGLLTLEASITFGQGAYVTHVSLRADWPTLDRVRDELRSRVARLPGVRFDAAATQRPAPAP